jgi:hypothetical protein
MLPLDRQRDFLSVFIRVVSGFQLPVDSQVKQRSRLLGFRAGSANSLEGIVARSSLGRLEWRGRERFDMLDLLQFNNQRHANTQLGHAPLTQIKDTDLAVAQAQSAAHTNVDSNQYAGRFRELI